MLTSAVARGACIFALLPPSHPVLRRDKPPSQDAETRPPPGYDSVRPRRDVSGRLHLFSYLFIGATKRSCRVRSRGRHLVQSLDCESQIADCELRIERQQAEPLWPAGAGLLPSLKLRRTRRDDKVAGGQEQQMSNLSAGADVEQGMSNVEVNPSTRSGQAATGRAPTGHGRCHFRVQRSLFDIRH